MNLSLMAEGNGDVIFFYLPQFKVKLQKKKILQAICFCFSNLKVLPFNRAGFYSEYFAFAGFGLMWASVADHTAHVYTVFNVVVYVWR